jgi:2-desacetyl-2-hydroxyethyl bacteriochlorophyllide A dehydrogenase
MRGIIFTGDRQLELRDFPDPSPGPREVVVEMKASGMCGSDLTPYRQPAGKVMPIIRGHEPCGVVVERGSAVFDDEAPIGQRVMIHHYSGCGQCKYCRVGYAQLCVRDHLVYGGTAHGGHARYILVKPYMLVPLDDALSFEQGAAISCGTGTAYGALKRLDVSGRDTLAIFGQGPVGLSGTMLAKAMGARVIAVESNAERRALAKQFGADVALENEQSIKELTRGEGVDMAIECSGVPAARVAAVRSAKTWGTVCFVGEGGEVTLDVSRDMLRKQLTLIGSWTFSAMGQAECARFIADNKIDLEKIFSHRWKLEQADEAYRVFDTQSTGKGVIVF